MNLFVVVCYDISDDRARLSVGHILMGYGVRAQKSVFECSVETEGEIRKIRSLLEPLLGEGDSLRIYPLCPKDRGDILFDGGLPPENAADFVLVE